MVGVPGNTGNFTATSGLGPGESKGCGPADLIQLQTFEKSNMARRDHERFEKILDIQTTTGGRGEDTWLLSVSCVT